MTDKNKRISPEYTINGQLFKTIENMDESGNRIFVTATPKNNQESVRSATILDQQDLINWRIKESHLKTIGSNSGSSGKWDYTPALAGSFQIGDGTTSFVKREGAEVVVFPIGAISPEHFPKIIETKNNFGSGTTLSVYSDSPCWLGYASGSGTIGIIN